MNLLHHNPYVQDILSQANSVKVALEKFDPTSLKSLTHSLQHSDFDRSVLTGMGGSLFASYPIWLHLVKASLPAYWIDCAELIHAEVEKTFSTCTYVISLVMRQLAVSYHPRPS